jgi:SAM-dependent methyltransferase
VKEYYAGRAGEYDPTSWDALDAAEREVVEQFVASLPSGRVLDIGCGTGSLTRFLRGSVCAVDQSSEMLELARLRAPAVEFVHAEVPPLPFPGRCIRPCFLEQSLLAHRRGCRARRVRRRGTARRAYARRSRASLATRSRAGVVGASSVARCIGVLRVQALLHARRVSARVERRRRACIGRIRCRANSHLVSSMRSAGTDTTALWPMPRLLAEKIARVSGTGERLLLRGAVTAP